MLSLPDFPVRQRDFLLEITRAITAQLDLGEVLRRVLYASTVMITGRVGLIALRNEIDGLFYVRALSGIDKERVPLINEKLHELVIGSDDVEGYRYLDLKLREIAEIIDESLRQSVAMPLTFAGNPLGLLIVFRSYQANVTQNDMQIMQSFADQAAIAVHNAQLYERIDQERQRLAAILENSADGFMILDADLIILQVNYAFEKITGWPANDAVGLSQDDVIIWERLEQTDLRTAIERGWPKQSVDNQGTRSHYVEGEIKRLDGMSQSIGISYAGLTHSDGQLANVIASIRDITHFRRAQEMQNVFISTVSHELRTPVALIKGYASTMNREDAKWDAAVVQDSLRVIEEESDRLAELIDDLLTASRIQAERSLSLNRADVRLDQLAASCVGRFSPQTKIHEFALSFQDSFPAISGDERLLRQVIDNLLTNAIKYSPAGGTITVGGRYTKSNVTLFVRDEGVGIAEADIPHVFERFYRVEGALTRKTKGTGLGLYLVKAIVDAHHGAVHVKSTVGGGSTFYFTLPRD